MWNRTWTRAASLAAVAGALALAAPALAQNGNAATTQPSREKGPATRPAESMQPKAPTKADGKVYPVAKAKLVYDESHPGHPPIAELAKTTVKLGVTEKGFVKPREGLPTRKTTIAGIASLDQTRFYGSAIQHVARQLLDRLHEMGLIGVWVGPHPKDIHPKNAKDRRPEGDTTLRYLIRTSSVEKVRTVAKGERIPSSERVNNPAHAEIREDSPVKPSDTAGKPDDLLHKAKVDRYVHLLGRHPGRRVDVSISPADEGDAALDYLVRENKPWTAYVRGSKTGTESTQKWRTTFGFQHNQLTGNNDIFNAVYSTAGFNESNAFNVSYEAPVGDNRRLRWKVDASYNEYDASQVGFAGLQFKGEGMSVGGDLIWNFYQDGPLFLDLETGLSYEQNEVENEVTLTQGEIDLLIPHIGVRMERRTRTARSSAFIDLKVQTLGNSKADIAAQGRTAPDERWARLTFNASHGMYLDKLIYGKSWKNPATPDTSTLAHELKLEVAGQTSFGNRLIPTKTETLGGMHTVRGYPESQASGDNALRGSIEYLFHVPQVLGVKRDPDTLFGEPFRTKRQHAFGSADWDLALKTFLDMGWVNQAEAFSFENDETLIGAGVGVDMRFKQNVNVTVDWGFALSDTSNDQVTAGSSQVEISATLLY